MGYKNLIITLINSFFCTVDELMTNLIKGDMLKLSTSLPGDAGYNPTSLSPYTILGWLRPIALSLTIVYFIVECNKRWAIEGNDIQIKTFGAPFFKLALAAGIIGNIQQITVSIQKGINGMIGYADSYLSSYSWSTLNTDSTTSGSVGEVIFDNLGGSKSTIIALILILFLIVFILVSLVIKLMFFYKAICFKVEFFLRIGVTSIACADIYSGSNSQAARYLKSLVGFGLYGMSFIMIPAIVTNVISSDIVTSALGVTAAEGTFSNPWEAAIGSLSTMGDVLKVLIVYTLAPVASLGMINVAKQVSKEALG